MTITMQRVRAVPAALTLLAVAAMTALDRGIERTRRDDRGQATAEYALVLLGAAAVALAVVSWASRTNLIGKLLDLVFGGLFKKAG